MEEEERACRSKELMGTIATSLAERKPQRPRHEFGVDSLKLTKLTLSGDIEAFMTTFERSMEAHDIERGKWPVLLGPQLTGTCNTQQQKLQGFYQGQGGHI